jgi:hypothetical protein
MMLLGPLGAYDDETIRAVCKDNAPMIECIAARVQERVCTCCSMAHYEGELELLDCGHYLCVPFCIEKGHRCVACALAT